MKRLVVLLQAFLVLGVLPGYAAAETCLNENLGPYLTEYNLPSLAAAVIKNGVLVAAGATGLRRADREIPVNIDDRYHIGSNTKAMTAVLAAMLVEEGELEWTTTIAEVFPELAETMDPGFRSVTLQQILSHTSGIPTDSEETIEAYMKAMLQEGNLDEMRYSLLKDWCPRPLAFEPGTAFAYSNMGYTFAGAVVERITGMTWDEVITERFFDPLGMKTAGLGPPASLGRTDAAIPHKIAHGVLKPMLSGPNGDIPAVIGPAGIAHMSILDFAAWAGWNAGEGKRGPTLVSAETLQKLHQPVVSMQSRKDPVPGTPPGGDYGLGWGILEMEWAPRPLIYHGGSNGMNLAHIWVDTKQDLAMVTMTNVSGRKADMALFNLARELYQRFTE